MVVILPNVSGGFIPRQLPLSLMVVFAIRIARARRVPVQRFHDTNPREHRRPVMLGHQDQRFHRGLPFLGVVFRPSVAW